MGGGRIGRVGRGGGIAVLCGCGGVPASSAPHKDRTGQGHTLRKQTLRKPRAPPLRLLGFWRLRKRQNIFGGEGGRPHTPTTAMPTCTTRAPSLFQAGPRWGHGANCTIGVRNEPPHHLKIFIWAKSTEAKWCPITETRGERGSGTPPGGVAVCSGRCLLASRHLPLPFP